MIRPNSLWLLILFLSLAACGHSQKLFSIGGSTYKIPSDYLVATSLFDNVNLDIDTSMVALSFHKDQDFSDYRGANAWLTQSPITAILFSRQGTTLTGFSPSLSSLEKFSSKGNHVIEFEKCYRMFKGDSRISWQVFPKQQATLEGDVIKAKWMADCIPLGGMKGSDRSHESIDIPTSCNINIEYKNAILSLTTSEKNLLDHVEKIVALMLQKLDSWGLPSSTQ